LPIRNLGLPDGDTGAIAGAVGSEEAQVIMVTRDVSTALSRNPSRSGDEGAQASRASEGLARASMYVNAAFSRILLTTLYFFALLVVLVRSFKPLADLHSADTGSHSGLVWMTLGPLALTVLCALPLVLMYCIKSLIVGSLDARTRFHVSSWRAGADHAPGDRATNEASRLWQHEIDQFTRRNLRLWRQGSFYELFCVLVFSLGAVILVGRAKHMGTGQLDPLGAVALAVTSAAVFSFLGEAGRMIVRVARRDASERMLAWATRRLLVVVTGAALVCTLVITGNFGNMARGQGAAGVFFWVLLGAGTAVLGDRATMAVNDRVARIFSVTAPARRDEGFKLVEGLCDDDLDRLAEEGIDTVHALAFYSTPKLFLSTPYTLPQICDWQDQCLLVVRLGRTKAAFCREHLLVRGATDMQRVAQDFVADRLLPDEKDDLVKLLGLASKAPAKEMLLALSQDPIAARLEIFRHAMPESVPSSPRATNAEVAR
jgi:hypothetical protein